MRNAEDSRGMREDAVSKRFCHLAIQEHVTHRMTSRQKECLGYFAS
jgi:hypothetical protein